MSHDERFLGALTRTRWELAWTDGPGGDAELTTRVVSEEVVP